MALIKPGSIVCDIRGSVGDETYARNQGGLYVKARVAPTDPNTAPQQACRAAVTALSQYWSATLTEAQRADWRAYAHKHPRADRFGSPNLTNGYTRFIRINALRYRVDVAVAYPNPPTNPPLHPPIFTLYANEDDEIIQPFVPPLNYDPPFNQLRLWLFAGITVPPGRNFYNGPWLYLASNKFTNVWEHPIWTIPSARPTTVDHKIFCKLIAQKDDTGELSSPYQTYAIIQDSCQPTNQHAVCGHK